MKHLVAKKTRPGYSLLLLLLSIILSEYLATSVNLFADELGALINIYLPLLTGLLTLLLLGGFLLNGKSVRLKRGILIICICINLFTGLYLKFSFRPFTGSYSIPGAETAADTVNDGVLIQNLDEFPDNNHLAFSLVYSSLSSVVKLKPNSVTNLNHDKVSICIQNNKKDTLTINKATFSEKGLWSVYSVNGIAGKPAFPVRIAPGASTDITIAFTADAVNKRVAPGWWKALFKLQFNMFNIGRAFNYQLAAATTCANLNGTLRLETNNPAHALKTIYLSGIWQYRTESDWEPDLQRELRALNFKTNTGFKNFDNGLKGSKVIPASDEIAAGYFKAADPALPVRIKKLASYHGCCLPVDADTLNYYYRNQARLTPLLINNFRSGQMLLPKENHLSNNFTLFEPLAPFALQIGLSSTDRNKNFQKKIGIRVWKAIDAGGKPMPAAYIIGSDYLGTRGTNYDYQDNVYLLENAVPLDK